MFKFLKNLFSYAPTQPHPAEDIVVAKPVIKAGIVKQAKKIAFPTTKVLKGLTKVQIEELARNHGIELDRRKTKVNMIADFKKEHSTKK